MTLLHPQSSSEYWTKEARQMRDVHIAGEGQFQMAATSHDAAVQGLVEALRAQIAFMYSCADRCDTWANESRTGGWSTHQVTANRSMADDIRRMAAAMRADLAAYEASK